MIFTITQINDIWLNKTAYLNRIYLCEDMFRYKGLADGTLTRILTGNLDDYRAELNAQSKESPTKDYEYKLTVDGLVESVDTLVIKEDGDSKNIQSLLTITTNIQKELDNLSHLTFYAGEALGSPRVIMINNNLAYLYDLSESNVGKVVGLSLNSSNQGGKLSVKTKERLITSGLVANSTYYASTLGVITTVIPTIGVCLEVGYAVSTTDLIINIQPPIILV